MNKVLLLKFGELFLKGKNRREFIKMLKVNLQKKLKGFKFVLTETQGRLLISGYEMSEEQEIIEKVQQVFGLIGVTSAFEIDTSYQEIVNQIEKLDLQNYKTFKVEVKRADKTFEISSMEMEKLLGSVVLNKNQHLKVDLYKPEVLVNVEIRVNKKTYIYTNLLSCVGGLPLGSAGKGLLLLSGGIDSPVAGFLVSKRGLKIEAVHFHSYPYTSVQAKDKVVELANKISEYCGEIKLHIVSFTEIQEQIHRNCEPEFMITIMRRFMMRIAEKLCQKNGLGAIVTGESLGQVASQTMQSMTVTNSVVCTPVFRPVLTFDKEEIMDIAKKIKTFDTSILPYEDCCTVFLPKNPVIHPALKRAERNESFLDVEKLVDMAIANEEVLLIDNY